MSRLNGPNRVLNGQEHCHCSRFVRIAREAVGSIDDQLINIDCKLSMDAYHRIVWLDGHVETNVPMECQRCLDTVEIALVSDFHLAHVDDESLIERLDEDADFYRFR